MSGPGLWVVFMLIVIIGWLLYLHFDSDRTEVQLNKSAKIVVAIGVLAFIYIASGAEMYVYNYLMMGAR